MSDESPGLLRSCISFDPPVARYTPDSPIPDQADVERYIDELQYQHDPVTTIQLSWMLEEMPDYQKRFPYFGVPLSSIGELIDKHEPMEGAPVQATVGLDLNAGFVQTIQDTPIIDENINIDEFSELISDTQASTDRLFNDIGLFACQYTGVGASETSHNVVYATDPRDYDYFITFKDEYVESPSSGGKTFHELDAVTFTDTIAGLLQMKAQMLVDAATTDEMKKVYATRFVYPLLSPFAASRMSTRAEVI